MTVAHFYSVRFGILPIRCFHAMVEKGTVVSLEGVLAAGKDLGFGYKYDVLIEDAVVVK